MEQYLGAPIETILTQLSQVPVTRAQIVEIGNLAAQDMSKAKLMVAFLVFHLSQNNVSWAVCTGTAAVRYVLQQMGLHFQVLEKPTPKPWAMHSINGAVITNRSLMYWRLTLQQRWRSRNSNIVFMPKVMQKGGN